jgi:hypothetical protein
MNSKERLTARYRAKCAAENKFTRYIGAKLAGCNERVYKATLPLSVRSDSPSDSQEFYFRPIGIYPSRTLTAR